MVAFLVNSKMSDVRKFGFSDFQFTKYVISHDLLSKVWYESMCLNLNPSIRTKLSVAGFPASSHFPRDALHLDFLSSSRFVDISSHLETSARFLSHYSDENANDDDDENVDDDADNVDDDDDDQPRQIFSAFDFC